MHAPSACVSFMDILCPRCGGRAEPVGHEDARAYFECGACNRVWAYHVAATLTRPEIAPAAPCVVVADDSPEMLGLLAAWLEDERCVVIAVASGREALDAVAVYRPDVVFLDVVIPPPDGFQVAERIARQAGPSVVLMTGMSKPDARRAADVGAVRLLQKPFTRETVLDALAVAIERRQGHDRPRVAANVGG